MKLLTANIRLYSREQSADVFRRLRPVAAMRINRLAIYDDRLRSAVAQQLVKEGMDCFFSHDRFADRPYEQNGEADGYFSISHSGDYVAVAFSHRPVGVDIQCPVKPDQQALYRFCTEEERAYLDNGRQECFFTLWTMKEAYAKMHGCGLSGLGMFHALFYDGKPLCQYDDCHFEWIDLEGCYGCVCELTTPCMNSAT